MSEEMGQERWDRVRQSTDVETYMRVLLRVIHRGVAQRVDLSYTVTDASPETEENQILLVHAEDEQLLAKLPVPSDIGAAFSTLCRSTEIPEECGSCLSHHFKLPDGSFDTSVVAKKPWADIKAQIASRKQEMGPLVWVNVVGESRPLLVPYCKAPFDRGSSYELVGVIYKEETGRPLRGAVKDEAGGWMCVEDNQAISGFDVLMRATMGAFSLLYRNKPLIDKVVAKYAGIFEPSRDEEDKIRGFYDGTGRSYSDSMVLPPRFVELEPIKPQQLQVAASMILNIEWRTPFLLETAEYDQLVEFFEAKGLPIPINQYVEGSASIYGVRNGIVYNSSGSTFRSPHCEVCLRECTQVNLFAGGPRERRFCPFHYPNGSVSYAVYLLHPVSKRKDLKPRVDWGVVRLGTKNVKPPLGFRVDYTRIYFCTSIEEVRPIFFAFVVAHWLSETLAGRVPERKDLWMDIRIRHEKRDLPKHLRPVYKKILTDFRVGVEEKPVARRRDWGVDEALKFRFIFIGDDLISKASFRSIYLLAFEANDEKERVYVGKCNIERAAAQYGHRVSNMELRRTRCLALAPSPEMLDFLEPLFQVSVALASMLGLKMTGCPHEVLIQNNKLERLADIPSGLPSIQEYIAEITRDLFGVGLSVALQPGDED